MCLLTLRRPTRRLQTLRKDGGPYKVQRLLVRLTWTWLTRLATSQAGVEKVRPFPKFRIISFRLVEKGLQGEDLSQFPIEIVGRRIPETGRRRAQSDARRGTARIGSPASRPCGAGRRSGTTCGPRRAQVPRRRIAVLWWVDRRGNGRRARRLAGHSDARLEAGQELAGARADTRQPL